MLEGIGWEGTAVSEDMKCGTVGNDRRSVDSACDVCVLVARMRCEINKREKSRKVKKSILTRYDEKGDVIEPEDRHATGGEQ